MVESLIADYLAAFGTIAAVIVALFTQVYLLWKRRPRLFLAAAIDDSSIEASQDTVITRRDASSADGIVELWIRVRVCAKRGKRPARDVKAIVTAVRRLDGDFDKVVPSGPLIWSSVGASPQMLLSGTWMRLDVLRYRLQHPEYRRQLEVEIGYDFSILDEQTVLPDGRFAIDIALGADDAKTSYWQLVFQHRGNPDAVSDEDILAQVELISLEEVKL